MAEVTLGFDELETNDLPPVCVECGSPHGVVFTPRTFMRRSLIPAYGLLFAMINMGRTRRVTVEVPLCPAHGGPRLFAHQRTAWWGLRTLAIEPDRITIGGASEVFAAELRRWREGRRHGEIGRPAPPRQRVQVQRGTGGGGTALKVLGILVAVMVGFMAVGAVVLFAVMGLGMTALNRPGPTAPPAPPPAPAAAAAIEPRPEGVVAALMSAVPQAGAPAGLPWAPLALAARKTTFHLLEDAALTKALVDLRAQDPFTVEAAAQKLAAATPEPSRRREAADALAAAAANPFPSARQAAAAGLAVWGTADDVPTLAKLLADPFPDVKKSAIAAVAALRDEKAADAALPELEKVARDRNPFVAQAAAEAVKALKDRRKPEEKLP